MKKNAEIERAQTGNGYERILQSRWEIINLTGLSVPQRNQNG